ncbi:hypothetical protein AAEO56_01925 [Flavobacterium sp. DGU11]|uniref:Uncharacterized protein n=1 Tax=Flavobacterium arundinis TaxID=3139143 RepID=A0ABU9HTX8_9FLAO
MRFFTPQAAFRMTKIPNTKQAFPFNPDSSDILRRHGADKANGGTMIVKMP